MALGPMDELRSHMNVIRILTTLAEELKISRSVILTHVYLVGGILAWDSWAVRGFLWGAAALYMGQSILQIHRSRRYKSNADLNRSGL